MDMTRAGWRKSSYSGNNGDDCVEVSNTSRRVVVRDTKDRTAGPTLAFAPNAWKTFTTQLKRRATV
jgi:hypothetical protein